ncbi:hypothetical protein TYRP_015187 [Tyrophagus putrescentiae]|nr:hypothetical protein TYRP_015187 [Tyrophagus putrescentiae]
MSSLAASIWAVILAKASSTCSLTTARLKRCQASSSTLITFSRSAANSRRMKAFRTPTAMMMMEDTTFLLEKSEFSKIRERERIEKRSRSAAAAAVTRAHPLMTKLRMTDAIS